MRTEVNEAVNQDCGKIYELLPDNIRNVGINHSISGATYFCMNCDTRKSEKCKCCGQYKNTGECTIINYGDKFCPNCGIKLVFN